MELFSCCEAFGGQFVASQPWEQGGLSMMEWFDRRCRTLEKTIKEGDYSKDNNKPNRFLTLPPLGKDTVGQGAKRGTSANSTTGFRQTENGGEERATSAPKT